MHCFTAMAEKGQFGTETCGYTVIQKSIPAFFQRFFRTPPLLLSPRIALLHSRLHAMESGRTVLKADSRFQKWTHYPSGKVVRTLVVTPRGSGIAIMNLKTERPAILNNIWKSIGKNRCFILDLRHKIPHIRVKTVRLPFSQNTLMGPTRRNFA